MKALISLGILLALALTASAQGTLGKTRIGFNGSANYTYRILENQNDDNEITQDFIDHYNEFETPELGFSAGINFDTNISERWKLEIGVSVSDQTYSYFVNDLVFGDLIDPRRGLVINPTGDADSYKRRSTFRYVGAPIGAVYRIGFEKVKFIGNLGIVPQFLLEARNDRTLTYADGSQEKSSEESTDDYESFNLSPYVGFGLELAVSQMLALRLQPIVRYGIMDIDNQNPWSTNLYSSEFNVALFYSLAN